MSKKNKSSLYGKPSTYIRNLFDEACHKLGMEIRNEERAQENQTKLRESLFELEKAFNAAVEREQEAAQQKSKADTATKAFSDKVEDAPVNPESVKEADAQP